jgi:hypothetical protein
MNMLRLLGSNDKNKTMDSWNHPSSYARRLINGEIIAT